MKLEDFLGRDLPVAARFETIGDACSGIITFGPEYQPDRYDDSKQVLVVGLLTPDGPRTLFGRTQMPEALVAALRDSGATAMVPGGKLGVTFVKIRGRTKIYEATYSAPDTSRPTWSTTPPSYDSSGARSFAEPLYPREDLDI